MRPVVIGFLVSKKHPNHVERTVSKTTRGATFLLISGLFGSLISARPRHSEFRVIAFFTADIDYEHRYDTTNKKLSYTLNNPVQDRLVIDALLPLGGVK